MPTERGPTVLVAIILATAVVPVSAQGGATAATNEPVTRQPIESERVGSSLSVQELPPNRTGGGPPPMTARVTNASTSSFRVAVRNARYGDSATVDPPPRVDTAGDNTDLRTVAIVSRSTTSRFDLDFSLGQNLSMFRSAPVRSPPQRFDTPLLYSRLDTTAAAEDVALTYEFDIEQSYLRAQNARVSDVVIAVYRGGRWEPVDVTPRPSTGNESIISASIGAPGLVAVGLRHPKIRVSDVRSGNGSVLSNRTSQLAVTFENRGSRDGTETFTLTADDRQLANTTVSVPAGRQRTVMVPVEFRRAGETDVEIGAYETELAVAEPTPQISVTQLSLDRSQIRTGENATVVATVQNTGTASGSGVVRFSAFGDVITTKQVTVTPGRSRTVRFSQRFDAPGTYQMRVNNRTETIRVRGGANWESTPPEDSGMPTAAGTESDSAFEWALLLLGAGIVLLFGLATVGRVLWGR